MENKNFTNYKSEICIGNDIFTIIEEKSNDFDDVNLDKILNRINILREKSDNFLQQIINQNQNLLIKENKNEDEDCELN